MTDEGVYEGTIEGFATARRHCARIHKDFGVQAGMFKTHDGTYRARPAPARHVAGAQFPLRPDEVACMAYAAVSVYREPGAKPVGFSDFRSGGAVLHLVVR